MEAVSNYGSAKTSRSIRKLKQSRLSFQVLSSGTTKTANKTESPADFVECRKRKPSTDGLDLGNVSKIGRVLQSNDNFSEKQKKDIELLDNGGGTGDNSHNLAPAPLIEPIEQSRKSDGKRSNKKNKKHASRKQNSDKIVIKLPLGKRKYSTNCKTKTSKKSMNKSESLNMEGNFTETIQLDDSELSEGTAEENIQNNLNSSELLGAQQVIKLISSQTNVQDMQRSPTSVNSNENQFQMETSTEDICSSNRKDLNSVGCMILKSSNSPIEPVTSVCDIDSSEEDIYMLCTPNSKSTPNADETARKLTPKQIARRQEYEIRLAKKLEEKEEKRCKLQEEKIEKAREKEKQERQRKRDREEKEEQRRKEREEKEELKRKEREEKEELKRKEREEKEKKRQAEIDQKNEEKRQKEEERRKKEEQKEEERKRKEEEKDADEKRKLKVAQAFTSFFVKKLATGTGRASDDENSLESSLGASTSATSATLGQQRFMPFCVKGDMRLAPLVRRVLGPIQKENLEHILTGLHTSETALSDLYLGLLKQAIYKTSKTGRTWNTEEEDEENDDVIVVDDTVCHQIEEDPGKRKQKLRAKFLLFDENRRPPFRGTWRKRSLLVAARRPFTQDTKYFDYEVDSDDEWEEDEPGESLHGSDDEKDLDPEEDYEVDNEFFVPHGHLSDEELQAEGDGGFGDNRPEVQKAKLKIMQQEFVTEMKKKTEKIKPMLIGCIWESFGKSQEDAIKDRQMECSTIIWKMLYDRAMLYDVDEPISFTLPPSPSNVNRNGVVKDTEVSSPGKENEKGPKKIRITDDAVKDLVRLVHGNINNRKFLVREFQSFWANRNNTNEKGSRECGEESSTNIPVTGNGIEFSLESIRTKIREIAEWGACPLEGPMKGKLCWTVDEEVLAQYGLQSLNMPNEWKYHLKGNTQVRLQKKIPVIGNELARQSISSNAVGKATIETKVENNRAVKVSLGTDASPLISMTQFGEVFPHENEVKRLSSSTNCTKTIEQPSQESINSEVVKDSESSSSDGKHMHGRTHTKKRVQLLMSMPRGQSMNQSTKTNLISQFLANGTRKLCKRLTNEEEKSACGEVIEIDSS